MPKIVDYEKKRQQIIEKATKVFMEKGYYATNLSGIANECGMGRTTIYQYFKNKEEIFLHVIQNIFNIIEDDCKKVIAKPGLSFIEKIKGIVSSFGKFHQEEKSKMFMLAELPIIRHGENHISIKKIQDQFTSRIAQMLKGLLHEGIKSKELKDINEESMSYTLYAMVEAIVFQSSTSSNFTADEYINNINLLIEGLKA